MGSRRSRSIVILLLALVLGLALRLWFIAHRPALDGDSLLYGGIARNLLGAGIYGYSPDGDSIEPTLIRLPGYPLFLAACFRLFGSEHYTAVLRTQALVDLGSCLLLGALARRLFGERAGLAALLLAALCPFTANYVAVPLTETLTLASLVLALYALCRWADAGGGWNRWLWCMAAAAGYSVLLRPEQGLLLPTLALAMLFGPRQRVERARPWKPALALAVCALLPLVPWTVRNWKTFGVFQPLAPRYATEPGEAPPLGFQRWFRTWAIDFAATEDVYWSYDGAEVQADDIPQRAFSSPAERRETLALLADYNVTHKPTPEIDARFAALAERRVREAPVRYYLVLPSARLLNMLLRPRLELMPAHLEWWRFAEHPRETVLASAYALWNAAYLALGIAGLMTWSSRTGDRAVLLAALLSVGLRILLLLTIDNSEPRYTLEFFPVWILAASALVAAKAPRPAST